MMKKALRILALTVFGLSALAGRSENVNSLKNTITDNSIVFPESFETDTKELMNNWYLQNYATLDAYVENSKAELEDDATYIKRLRALPTTIEMPYNSVVKKYIEMYVKNRRTLVEEMLGMSTYYMPIFEQALEQEGLPQELKYLPVIESAMNPNAVSRVGAAGLWQFMISTAKGLGLEVNSLVDERRDPYRSSAKAAAYLKNLYNIYHDWSLVIAAYNCGPGNVNKALRRAGGTGKDFWEIYPYLPRETRGYVPAFIAANYVMTYFKNHNISPSLAKKPLFTDTVNVSRRVNFNQISKVLNMPMEELRVLNPQFRRDIIPGETHTYALCLPTHQVYSYIMSEDSIVNYRLDLYGRRDVVEPAVAVDRSGSGVEGVDFKYETQTVTKWHKVGRKETLNSIARKYGVSASSIQRTNGLKKRSVKRGQSLKIATTQRVKVPIAKPETNDANENEEEVVVGDQQMVETEEADNTQYSGSHRLVEKKAETKPAQQPKKETPKQSAHKDKDGITTHHTVKAGESLYSIASSNGLTVDELKAANGITDDAVQAGRSLVIPAPGTVTSAQIKANKAKHTTAKEHPAAKHTVKAGESLNKIATENGITIDELKAANGIEGDVIQAGQTLVIPAKGSAVGTGSKAAKEAAKPMGSHTVKAGESLGKIATANGITVEELKAANNLTDNNIMVGQTLKVPGGSEESAPAQTKKAEKKKPTTKSHSVKSGETLSSIAARYGTTVDAIKKASGMRSDNLSVGQTLTIPTKASTSTGRRRHRR